MSAPANETLRLKNYVIGFVASLYITVTAYYVVAHHLITNRTVLVGVISGLALIQLVVQLWYFLHLGQETKPRWKLVVFWLMLGFVLIIVGGSIWIIHNLDYHHESPQQIQQYLKSQDGL